MTTIPALQKIHKGIVYAKKEDKCSHENMGKLNLT
jgi:hypothetical protein